MAEFAPKHLLSTSSQVSRADSPAQSQTRGLSSIIGNQAMQRLLQREAEEQAGVVVTFPEYQSSVIQAVNTLGGAVTPDYVTQSSAQSLLTAVLRVGKRSHRLMPSMDKQMAGGNIQPGSLEGTGQLVYIKLQSLPGKSRITCKVVDVETSAIISAGKHDFEPSPQAMTDAVMHAIVQMGVPWTQSKEPYTGSVNDG